MPMTITYSFSRLAALLVVAGATISQTVEAIAQESPNRITYTAHVGAGGSKAWNFVGATVEYFPSGDHVSLFATGGLGTILAGVGAAVYTNRTGSGLFASATAGIAGAHVQSGALLRMGSRTYLTLGVSYGSYFLQHTGFLPVAGLEYRW